MHVKNQRRCEILAEIIWDSRKNINEAIRLKSTLQPSHCDQLDTLQILLGDITQLISALLTKYVVAKVFTLCILTNCRLSAKLTGVGNTDKVI